MLEGLKRYKRMVKYVRLKLCNCVSSCLLCNSHARRLAVAIEATSFFYEEMKCVGLKRLRHFLRSYFEQSLLQLLLLFRPFSHPTTSPLHLLSTQAPPTLLLTVSTPFLLLLAQITSHPSKSINGLSRQTPRDRPYEAVRASKVIPRVEPSLRPSKRFPPPPFVYNSESILLTSIALTYFVCCCLRVNDIAPMPCAA